MEDNPEIFKEEEQNEEVYNTQGGKLFSFFPPVLLLVFLGISLFKNSGSYNARPDIDSDTGGINLTTSGEMLSQVKDTVYTDKETWLELRINEQYVYQHWRDGRVVKYPVSSGNKFLSKGIESRPGLFAIFYKNPHHKSSQFDDASLYDFMTFNQGIGFHSLDGTGYYGNLGVRPSSHGCIRMRHEDAKKLFSETPMGTIVLAHNGYSSRVVSFAPKDFVKKEYTKEEYKAMLARNLKNVLEGNYYTLARDYFIVDPSVIPVSGVYIGYDRHVPARQKLPSKFFAFHDRSDKINRLAALNEKTIAGGSSDDSYSIEFVDNKIKTGETKTEVNISDDEVVKKYFHNPIGILPYFPPEKKAPKLEYTTTSNGTDFSN